MGWGDEVDLSLKSLEEKVTDLKDSVVDWEDYYLNETDSGRLSSPYPIPSLLPRYEFGGINHVHDMLYFCCLPTCHVIVGVQKAFCCLVHEVQGTITPATLPTSFTKSICKRNYVQ